MTPPVATSTTTVTTRPDAIDPGALHEVDLLWGEHIVRCWRTGRGFLVMTNLRCIDLWRKPLLLIDREWHSGPNFFFYNLAPPCVVLDRFVQLSEKVPENDARSIRIRVSDPVRVAREVEEAIPGGIQEWNVRRDRSLRSLAQAPPLGTPAPTVIREVVREIVKVRCSYCGHLMDLAAATCPTCGAPQS